MLEGPSHECAHSTALEQFSFRLARRGLNCPRWLTILSPRLLPAVLIVQYGYSSTSADRYQWQPATQKLHLVRPGDTLYTHKDLVSLAVPRHQPAETLLALPALPNLPCNPAAAQHSLPQPARIACVISNMILRHRSFTLEQSRCCRCGEGAIAELGASRNKLAAALSSGLSSLTEVGLTTYSQLLVDSLRLSGRHTVKAIQLWCYAASCSLHDATTIEIC
jgi:hypothetical protein